MNAELNAGRVQAVLGSWGGGSGPLYRRLAEAVAEAIDRGEIAGDAQLPPERNLAQCLAISRSTVVSAYDQLQADGLVRRRQGSGTFVNVDSRPAVPDLNATLEGNTLFRGLLAGSGETVDFSLAAPLAAPAVARSLRELPERLPDLERLAQGYVPAGLPALRTAIADHLTKLGLPSSQTEILVTTGGQQALGLTAAAGLSAGDAVVVENPTYPGALDVFRAAGARLVSVPVDEEGMLVAGLRDLLARVAPRLIYVSSSFNNPTGAMLSQERRRDLARLAAEYQIPLLEDCVISEVCLTGRPMLPPIASFGDDGPVMTIGSMSKVFWGGLRVGWIRAPKPVIFRLAQLKAVHDLGSPVIDQVLCADLLRDHASEAREWRIRDCLPRLQHLTQELARLLPAWSCEQPQGGLALWVRLPDGSAADFQQAALRHGVELAAGPIFSPDGSHADRLRLGFALPTEQISEGVRRLASAWAAYLPRRDRPLLEAKLIV